MNRFLYLMLGLLVLCHPAVAVQADDTPVPFDDIRVEFELVNAEGELVTQQDILGRYVLLAFGFTRCAHICPMMAANMGMALKASQQDAVGIFISVDTERDTPASVQAYASSFNPSMMGLGGNYQQIRAAANHFNISFVVTKSQKAYTVEHTSDIFLIGPDGKVLEVFALNTPPTDMADAMDARRITESLND